MFYFSPNTIERAFENIIVERDSKIDNGFIGLLFSMKNATSNLPSASMSKILYDKEAFTNDLNHLFSFDEKGLVTPRSSSSFYILSNDYKNLVLTKLLKSEKLDIIPFAIVCMQTDAFDSELSEIELIKSFTDKFHLDDEAVNAWFKNTDEVIPLSYEQQQLSNEDRKRLIKKLTGDSSQKFTISMNGKWFDKMGGDFGSGTYAQTLIKTGTVKDLLFVPSGELQHNLGLDISNVKVEIQKDNLNILFFGPAGTGKSTQARKLLVEKGVTQENLTEVTFHPEYTYTDFIGGLKPQTLLKSSQGIKIHKSANQKETVYEDVEPIVEFKFEAGPFAIACIKAAQSNSEVPHAIIIDELNRGNVPEIMGDIFQLLDRQGSKSNSNIELISYLKGELGLDVFKDGFEIPPNLYIYATLNPADQNVFTLDTAFKRRWKRKYIPINYEQTECEAWLLNICGQTTNWLKFIKAVNRYLLEKLDLSEDKQLGQFFINFKEGMTTESIEDETLKVMSYLWEDVPRSKRGKLFNNELKAFSDLLEKLHSDDFSSLFHSEFLSYLNGKLEGFTEE